VSLLYDWTGKVRKKDSVRPSPSIQNCASAHHFYSILLMASGRQSEAVVEIRRAQELDPLSLIVNDVVGWIYYQGRQ
jgi:hypothetical protein